MCRTGSCSRRENVIPAIGVRGWLTSRWRLAPSVAFLCRDWRWGVRLTSCYATLLANRAGAGQAMEKTAEQLQHLLDIAGLPQGPAVAGVAI